MAVKQFSHMRVASEVVETCHKCNTRITDTVLVAMGRTWHLTHFTCAKCDAPIKESGFFVVAGKPYCADDYKALFGKKCCACHEVIDTTIYTALDKHWHEACFKCHKCKNPITTKEFVEKRGTPYCIDCVRK